MTQPQNPLTVGEFVDYLAAKAPAWVEHDGMRFRYEGSIALSDWLTPEQRKELDL